MAYKARFVHGNRYFNLDAGEYDLFQDFIFPAAEEALNVSTGNVGSMSGGRVVSKTPQDRWWAWSVRIQGTSGAQTHMAARRLSAWLNGALSDKAEELYFEYTPNYVVPAPIWGQHGAPYQWEVKQAIVDIDGSYYHYTIPDTTLIVPISLYVGPYALGARQRLAQAMGAVFEDTRGTTDGQSRGLVINGAITNRIVNPSFETNTTGWTAAGCTIERTTDQAWVGNYGLRQTVSTTNSAANAYITGNTGAPLAQQNYVLSARVYIPAQMIGKNVIARMAETGGASAAEITAEQYLAATAEGWHYMFASGTLKKADRTGLNVELRIAASASTPAGSWVIWDAIQLLGPDVYNIYPYIDGDQLGAAWSSTAHASTSTSTAGYCRIPVTSGDTFDMKQGTVCAVLKMPYASTDVPAGATNRVFYTNTALRVYYDQADGKFYIHDNTATVGVAASWAAGDIIVVHATWGPAGMKVYFNATASASQTYTNPGAAAYCYIGSNASSPPTERILATFLDFSVWNVPFTDAQVTADYALVSAHVRGGDGQGQRLSGIFCAWTKDGDNIVDNYTDATHNHYAIIFGIQGSTEAETEIIGTPGTAFSGLNLSNFATRRYFSPSVFFADLGGTAVADSVGGSAYVTSIGTSSSSFTAGGGAAVSWTKSAYPELSEVQFYLLARIKDASAAYIRIQPYVASNSYGVNINSDFSRPYATETSYRLFRTNMGVTQKNYSGYDTEAQVLSIYGYRSGTANVTTDYYAMFPRPYQYCFGYKMTSFKLTGNTLVKTTDTPYSGMVEVVKTVGDIVEFSPNRYNIFQTLMGYDAENPALAYTLTYDIYCTPRYLIL